MEINTFVPDKHNYLQMVDAIVKKPEILYSLGTLPTQRITSVAIVGTRSPTQYGTQVTFEFAYKLAQLGFVIISGLAYGVDAIAHKAALEAHGTTLAILAHGLDTVYPAGHQQLAQRIVTSGGGLISEYPAGTKTRKYHFLQRNRLISGLADAIIVIEAGERSGTLSTVSYALEQGKEVFAVPGNITSAQSVGPNRLIQQGAHPATSIEDILHVIAPHLIHQATARPMPTTIEGGLLLKHIRSGITDSEILQQQLQLSSSQFMQLLSDLEIEGYIRIEGSNVIARHI